MNQRTETLLQCVREAPGAVLSISDLSARLSCARTTVWRSLRELEREGRITRSPIRRGKLREIIVRPTPTSTSLTSLLDDVILRLMDAGLVGAEVELGKVRRRSAS